MASLIPETATVCNARYMSDDFYCDEAISGRTPIDVVLETDDVLAFHHTRPFWPVHIVVVPKQHVPSLTELGISASSRHEVAGQYTGPATMATRELHTVGDEGQPHRAMQPAVGGTFWRMTGRGCTIATGTRRH